MADVMELASAERADLAQFLATLTPQQWQAPSLCEGWRVRDVVAHVVSYDELDAAGLARRLLRGRFLLGRANAAGVIDYAQHSPQQLLELLHRSLRPRGLTAVFGGRIGLLDAMIHQQDIRRPLGLARDVPAERLRVALDFARNAPPIGAPWRIRGLRLVATDLDWATGHGDEVRGRAESLLMAMAGRRGIVDELTGAGQHTLAGRTGG
ncbi:MAG: maleylpyruvate isomerase family mycothiol-dependent enzyme [Mycobacterium sp.]